jgi:hypothetical protein
VSGRGEEIGQPPSPALLLHCYIYRLKNQYHKMDNDTILKMDTLSDIDKQRLALTGLEVDMKHRSGSI